MKTLKIIAAVTAFLILPISQDLRAQETASQVPPIGADPRSGGGFCGEAR